MSSMSSKALFEPYWHSDASLWVWCACICLILQGETSLQLRLAWEDWERGQAWFVGDSVDNCKTCTQFAPPGPTNFVFRWSAITAGIIVSPAPEIPGQNNVCQGWPIHWTDSSDSRSKRPVTSCLCTRMSFWWRSKSNGVIYREYAGNSRSSRICLSSWLHHGLI